MAIKRAVKIPASASITVKPSVGRKEVTAGSQNFGEFYKLAKVGDKFSGLYVNSRVIDSDMGAQRVHDFEVNEKLYTLGGSVDLNRKLFTIPFSTDVEVVLVEIKELKNGNTFKRHAIFVDENVVTKPEAPEDYDFLAGE